MLLQNVIKPLGMVRMSMREQNKIQCSNALPEQQAADIRFSISPVDQSADVPCSNKR